MSKHRCPVPSCPTPVARGHVLCLGHWALVPAALKRELYAAWDNERGLGTPQYWAARTAVITAAALGGEE